jgi:hypothetical protein
VSRDIFNAEITEIRRDRREESISSKNHFASKSKLSANGTEYESQGRRATRLPVESNQRISSPEKA